MENMLVLIPEGFFVKYFIYTFGGNRYANKTIEGKVEHKGKIRFSGISGKEIITLINSYVPDLIAIRVLYGGSEFGDTIVYDESVRISLIKQISQSPVHISLILEMIDIIEKLHPGKKIILHFETAFFTMLPETEQVYAVDTGLINLDIKRFGYHGLFHQTAFERVCRENKKVEKIISVCLDPLPEIAAINKNQSVMVSSGSTPLEGIPGNTTCGEIDPGIVLLLEEKKKCGPEMINEMFTKKSGLSAIAGKQISIGDVVNGDQNSLAYKIFEYRVLQSCGSAIALMDGFDAIVFSGRYAKLSHNFATNLFSKLTVHLCQTQMPKIYYLEDSLDQIIARNSYNFIEEKSNQCIVFRLSGTSQ